MVSSQEDLYALLQVAPSATQEEIGAAYARLHELYSPDRLQSGPPEFQDLATRRREELQAAYDVLLDPRRRAEYDLLRQPAAAAPSLDYRPLPPANRRERPSPSIPLPAVDDASRARRGHGRRSLVAPLLVGTATLVVLLIVVSTSIHTRSGAAALATPAIPNFQFPFDASQVEQARARAEEENTAEAWTAYGNTLYDNMEQMREQAPTAPQYLGLLPTWLDATQAYRRALERGAGPDIRADLALALFYYSTGSNDKTYTARALTEIEQAHKAAPDNSRVLLAYGLIQAGLNPPRDAEAVAAWRHLIAVAPQSSEAARARDLVGAYGQ
jgi:curved DNA-binding protein CbpA